MFGQVFQKVKSGVSMAWQKAKAVAVEVKEKAVALAGVAVGTTALGVHEISHAGTVTIPEVLGTGVSITDYLSAAILYLGAAFGVLIGAAVAFKLGWAAIGWIRRVV